MRKHLFALLAFCLTVSVGAQETLNTVFEVQVGDPAPAFFETTTNTVRSGTLNISSTLAGGTSIVIPSRQGGNSVNVVNPTDGTVAHTLDLTGVAGGTFAINAVGATADGQIYVCNLVTGGGTDIVRVYRWADDAAATVPTMIVPSPFTNTNRAGDALGVVQNPANPLEITVYVVGNNAASRVVRLASTDGGSTFTASEVGPTRAALGVDGDTVNGSIFLKSPSANIIEYDQAGTELNSIAAPYASVAMTTLEYELLGGRDHIAVANYTGGADFAVQVFDIEDRANPALVFTKPPTNPVDNANLNGTAGVALEVVNGLVTVFGLATNNYYGLYQQAAPVRINEIVYDLPGTDAGEYIELVNTGFGAVDISNFTIDLVNGSNGEAYTTVTIPAATSVAAGGYFVIGNATTVDGAFGAGTVDFNTNLDNGLQNGAPDGLILRDAAGNALDSLAYEADATFTVGTLTPEVIAEGGTGRAVSGTLASSQGVSLSRLPDATDTNSNLLDFANTNQTPGAANTSVALPFADSFTGAPNAAWLGGFVAPRVVDGATAVGVASTDGGDVFEVFDPTGGGDVAYLPGTESTINFEGEIFIPLDNANPWSTGVGIATRSESTWFSSFSGNGIENGFYLEYQNGSGVGLKGVANHAGSAVLIAGDGAASLNGGTFSTTVLGSTTAVNKGAWNSFRLTLDPAGDRLFASINGAEVFRGPIPTNGFNTSGGVVVGFRESHAGTPVAGEGTYVDGITVDTNVTLPPASSVTVDPLNPTPNNLDEFNTLMAAIHSFQDSGDVAISTDGGGVGINSTAPGPHTINIVGDVIDEVVRIDERVGAPQSIHSVTLVINGKGAAGTSVAVEPSAANNTVIICRDATGITDDDGFEIRTDIDLVFNNLTFVPSLANPHGDDMVTVDRLSASPAVPSVIEFNSCVFTTADASNNPVVTDKASAYVNNLANVATLPANVDKLIAVFPDAEESMDVRFTDCVISHAIDNDGYLDFAAAMTGGNSITQTLTSCVVSYNGVGAAGGVGRYGIQMSGTGPNSTFNITGSNVRDGVVTGLGGPTVIVGNDRGIQSFFGASHGAVNIDNTIAADNNVRQISLDADVDLVMADTLVQGPIPMVYTREDATSLATTWERFTFRAVGAGALFGDANAAPALTIQDAILAGDNSGIAAIAPFGVGDMVVNVDFVGVPLSGASAVTGLGGTSATTVGSNVVNADVQFLSTVFTSPDFLDVTNPVYAGAGTAGSDLSGGGDLVIPAIDGTNNPVENYEFAINSAPGIDTNVNHGFGDSAKAELVMAKDDNSTVDIFVEGSLHSGNRQFILIDSDKDNATGWTGGAISGATFGETNALGFFTAMADGGFDTIVVVQANNNPATEVAVVTIMLDAAGAVVDEAFQGNAGALTGSFTDSPRGTSGTLLVGLTPGDGANNGIEISVPRTWLLTPGVDNDQYRVVVLNGNGANDFWSDSTIPQNSVGGNIGFTPGTNDGAMAGLEAPVFNPDPLGVDNWMVYED